MIFIDSFDEKAIIIQSRWVSYDGPNKWKKAQVPTVIWIFRLQLSAQFVGNFSPFYGSDFPYCHEPEHHLSEANRWKTFHSLLTAFYLLLY